MARNIGNRLSLSLDAKGPSKSLVAYREASASATLDFDLVFSDRFLVYQVFFSPMIPSVDGANFILRCGTGSPTVTYDAGSNYKDGSTVRTYIDCSFVSCGNAAGEFMQGRLYISNPTNSSLSTLVSIRAFGYDAATGNVMGTEDWECYTPTTAVTSMQLSFDTGNITSGSVWVYGLCQSGIV